MLKTLGKLGFVGLLSCGMYDGWQKVKEQRLMDKISRTAVMDWKELHPHVTPGTDKSKMLEFLYTKKVFPHQHRTRKIELNVEVFNWLLDPSTAAKDEVEYYTQCRERLLKILDDNGDIKSNAVPLGVKTFEEFADDGPWKDPNASKVFWRDVLHRSPTYRVQKSGLCFFHAPTLLQHYLVHKDAAHLQEDQVAMIDMAKFIRQNFSAEELERFIFHDAGGSSFDTLKKILQPGSNIHPFGYLDKADEKLFVKNFDQFGPALLSAFKVDAEFIENAVRNTPCLGAKPVSGAEKGMHAMVVVGYRFEQEQLRLLVQNWWPNAQFIEMDLPYLTSHEATLWFVPSPQQEIPKDFPTAMAVFAETTLDLPERHLPLED